MRVLYVDDDRINILLFEEACRGAGDVEVVCAGSGGEALALAPEAAPDLLVIDLHLPDTSGYALLGALRRTPALGATPAFLCTADDPREVGAEALAAGFSGCWTKPVDAETLRAEFARLRGDGTATR
jgi:CheY-like chemotaxis protein